MMGQTIIFSHRDAKERGFSHEEEGNAEARERLGRELVKGIWHFFPELMARLRDIADPH